MDNKVKKVVEYAKKLGVYDRDSLDLISSMVLEGNSRILSPKNLFMEHLAVHVNRRTEAFFVFTLNSAHRVINLNIVTTGLVNRTIVHPREVFYEAIKDNATAIIIAHNHPSGNLEPSDDDMDITERLVKAGEVIGIPVLDHIVFTKGEYLSMIEAGMMELPS